jgi:hypothetical protein
VNVSLLALRTPWAPIVMMPHCTCVQSTSLATSFRSSAWNRAPGMVISVDQVPSAAIWPPLAA